MSTRIYVRTEFEAFHRWKDAPDDVAFLRDYHRHVFKVRVDMDVSHGNRDIEFFQFKRKLDSFINKRFTGAHFEFSCEQIASYILKEFNAFSVEVSEDGENGAVVTAGALKTQDKPAELVSLQHRTRCFVGTEAEGPFRGTENVLFVPGSIVAHELHRAVNALHKKPSRIYYCAGNDRVINTDTLTRLCRVAASSGGVPVDIEVADHVQAQVLISLAREYPVILQSLSCVVALTHTAHAELFHALDGVEHFHKYVDSVRVRWEDANGKTYETQLNDPIFNQDTFIE